MLGDHLGHGAGQVTMYPDRRVDGVLLSQRMRKDLVGEIGHELGDRRLVLAVGGHRSGQGGNPDADVLVE